MNRDRVVEKLLKVQGTTGGPLNGGENQVTLTELEHAEKCVQQQWHDLIMAEQQGNALEVLEQMYDTYILLAEEYNHCLEAYQQEHQSSQPSYKICEGACYLVGRIK